MFCAAAVSRIILSLRHFSPPDPVSMPDARGFAFRALQTFCRTILMQFGTENHLLPSTYLLLFEPALVDAGTVAKGRRKKGYSAALLRDTREEISLFPSMSELFCSGCFSLFGGKK